MNKVLKTVLCIVLAICIVGLVWAIYDSVMQPVRFNKEKAQRESVAIQRLMDIRDLQVAYKGVNGRFMASFDTLKQFYNNGEMTVLMQVGSQDDSAAVAHTDAVKKAHKNITPEGLYELYKQGDKDLVFSVENKIAVKDTLFHSRSDFDINSIDKIPFCEDQKIEMDAIVKKVSGVDVPLFEAKLPYKALLKGMDNQLRINLDADRRDQGKYEGLQVGSITAPNNNAGNWE